ncbi:MAG: hypothetical protein M3355_06745, partial [Actinomycetota bacterium]|nr:hypothetical protein [Actinomycetota bacterium]
RHTLHNEYCEYAVIRRPDGQGNERPKRVQITTELAEFWTCVATHDPDRLRAMALEVLGEEPSWDELYGVADPHALGVLERKVEFARTMAGNGRHRDLVAAGVKPEPQGRLNTDNALFMTHQINGLDDLIFIVLFGARRFAVQEAVDQLREATENDIFTGELSELVCRHADPTAAMGAYGLVLQDAMMAFADPLGMYIRPLNAELFVHNDKPIPEEWVRWGRGAEGMRQRLELGPGDDDDAFLDDILVNVGEPEPLTGGYQVVKLLEVGPLIAKGPTRKADKREFEIVGPGGDVDCEKTGVCDDLKKLQREHDRLVGTNGPASEPGA